MMKKILFAAAFALTPMMLTESASAQCYGRGGGYGGGYVGYAAPVISYRSAPRYYGNYRGGYGGYGGYGVPYRSGYRGGYGGFGGYGYGNPYYGRGTSIGIGRGGISLNFGF